MKLKTKIAYIIWALISLCTTLLIPWIILCFDKKIDNFLTIVFFIGIIGILLIIGFIWIYLDIKYAKKNSSLKSIKKYFKAGNSVNERKKKSLLKYYFLGLAIPELFGFIFYIIGVISSLQISLFDLEKDPNLEKTYLNILEGSSSNLTKYTVIAVIILFFIQILKSFNISVNKLEENTKRNEYTFDKLNSTIDTLSGLNSIAKSTENSARGIKEELRREIPNAVNKMQRIIDKSIDTFKSEFKLLHIAHNANNLTTTLTHYANPDEDEDDGKGSVYNSLLEQFRLHLSILFENFTLDENDPDRLDLFSFSILYQTYLEVEALNFETTSSSLKAGCRFPTRFANYALAVSKIVNYFNLYYNKDSRYEFYTILNRRPQQFFNLENHGSDLTWSIDFLEKFCRKEIHDRGKESPKYVRYFLCHNDYDYYENQGEFEEPPYYYRANEEFKSAQLLCYKKDKKIRPILWLNNPDKDFKVDTSDINYDKNLKEEFLPTSIFEALKKYADMNKWASGYIIYYHQDELTGDQKTEMEEILKLNKDLKGIELKFMKLGQQLEFYNHQLCFPKFIVFNKIENYNKFFPIRDEFDMPRDLFAIRDRRKNEWVLCLGTRMGHWDPLAVNLLFLTKNRPLNSLSWEDLCYKLDILFLDHKQLDKEGASIKEMGSE